MWVIVVSVLLGIDWGEFTTPILLSVLLSFPFSLLLPLTLPISFLLSLPLPFTIVTQRNGRRLLRGLWRTVRYHFWSRGASSGPMRGPRVVLRWSLRVVWTRGGVGVCVSAPDGTGLLQCAKGGLSFLSDLRALRHALGCRRLRSVLLLTWARSGRGVDIAVAAWLRFVIEFSFAHAQGTGILWLLLEYTGWEGGWLVCKSSTWGCRTAEDLSL